MPSSLEACSSLPRKEGFAYSRNNLVQSGLRPILRTLGIPDENVGRRAFRHGLATEVAESEAITVLQGQTLHADVRTTLKVYAHVIPQSQRNSMERIANRSIGTNSIA
jgi:integrase